MHIDLSASKKIIFLKSSETREPEKNDQQTSSFVFSVTKRNEMQMRCNFPFLFYEQREEGKEEEIKHSKITETQQSNQKLIPTTHD
jgi:hypothetical protein